MCSVVKPIVIKASGTSRNDQPFILLGLSQENWDRLRDRKPIEFNATALGFDGDIIIVGGDTEEDILDELRAHRLVTPLTRHHEGDTP